jgi:hypothetical protein
MGVSGGIPRLCSNYLPKGLWLDGYLETYKVTAGCLGRLTILRGTRTTQTFNKFAETRRPSQDRENLRECRVCP